MATAWKAYPAQLAARTAQRGTGVKIISGNDKKNDGATLLGGGTPASAKNNMFTVITSAGDDAALSAPYLQGSADIGTAKSLSAGTFSVQTAGAYVIQGVTSTLAGVANSFLTIFGASTGKYGGVHKNVVDEDGLQVTRGWEYASGQFASLPADLSVTLPKSDGSTTSPVADIDKAATPTRPIPGRLVITSGAAVTIADSAKSYSAKTG